MQKLTTSFSYLKTETTDVKLTLWNRILNFAREVSP